MDQERNNVGVNEARFALTLLTCLLVAIGYVLLLRLGGTRDTTDVTPDDASPPIVSATKVTEPPTKVLKLETPEIATPRNTPDVPANNLNKSQRR